MKLFRVLLTFGIFIFLWWFSCLVFNIPTYIFPTPLEVLKEFSSDPYSLIKHLALTFVEALIGLIIAWVFAALTSFIFFLIPKLEKATFQFIVGFKAIPLIAIAPLLILWLGNGLISKCGMAATICFFPIVIGYLKGFRNCTDDEIFFLRDLKLTRIQELLRFRLVKATPFWLAGLKVSSTLAVVGAIVAEFSGSNAGLGYIIIVSATRIDTPLLMVGIFLSAFCGIAMYWISNKIELLILQRTHMEPLQE